MARDAPMPGEEPLRGAVLHPVLAFAVGVVVPAGEFEERRDDVVGRGERVHETLLPPFEVGGKPC